MAGAASLTAAVGAFLFWHATGPRWKGPILLDAWVRDAMLIEDDSTRRAFSAVSDVPFYFLMVAPTVLDVGIVAAGVEGKPDVAVQMLGMNLLSYGVAGLLSYSVTTLVSRQRPFAEPCLADDRYDSGCGDTNSENSSFFSGHVAAAFTGAGVTCAHHRFLPLYGGGLADELACIVGLTMATTVGVLRIATDNHYLSDVLVGAGIGVAAGYGLPYLLHYQHALFGPGVNVAPAVVGETYGIAVTLTEL